MHIKINVIFILLVLNVICYGSKSDGHLSGSDTITIKKCIEITLQNNPKLKSIKTKETYYKGEKINSYSRFIPELKINYGAEKENFSSVQNIKSSTDDYKDGIYGIIKQRIFEFGGQKEEEINRILSERKSHLEYIDSLINNIYDIRLTYFSITVLKKEIENHTRINITYKEEYERYKKQLEQGFTITPNVLLAEINILNQEERITNLKCQLNISLAKLNSLLGKDYLNDSTIYIDTIPTCQIELDSCIALAKRNNTRIRLKKKELELAKIKLRQFYWNYSPDINLQYKDLKNENAINIDLQKDRADAKRKWSIDVMGIRRLNSSNNFTQWPYIDANEILLYQEMNPKDLYKLSLTLDFPLTNIIKTRGEYIKVKSIKDKNYYELQQLQKEIKFEIKKLFNENLKSTKNVNNYESKVRLSKERYLLALKLYKNKMISIDGLDTFRRMYFQDQDNLLIKKIEAITSNENLRKKLMFYE